MCGCGCLSYHLLYKPILSLQPRLAPRNPELAAQFSGPPGCLALRLLWAEGSGSPLASHPARTVTQRDVSQIAGDSTSHSRRLRSSDLGAAADSARSPQGSLRGIAPGRLSTLSAGSAVSPTLLTSPRRSSGEDSSPGLLLPFFHSLPKHLAGQLGKTPDLEEPTVQPGCHTQLI